MQVGAKHLQTLCLRRCRGRKSSVGLPAAGVNAADPVRAEEHVWTCIHLHTNIYMQVALPFLIKSSAELSPLFCLFFFSKVIYSIMNVFKTRATKPKI